MRATQIFRTLVAVGAFAGVIAVIPAHAEQHPFPLPPKQWPPPVDDQMRLTFLLADRLEYRWGEDADPDARVWDVQGWIGGDYNRFWFKTEGEDEVRSGTQAAEVQALYARRIAPFWYLQAGARYDAEPTPTRNFAVIGLQGLAVYWFNLEATAFVSDDGDASARIEAEYDLLLTQRLILQPRIETNYAFSEVQSAGVGQGVNDLELGLRLRYEIKREFAPYVGVAWTRQYGGTADLTRANGEDPKTLAVVAGVRFWY